MLWGDNGQGKTNLLEAVGVHLAAGAGPLLIVLVMPLILVLIVELLNSALESVVDRIGPEKHELSGRAKDMGSAAVFLSLVNAGVIWLLVLLA